LQYRPPVGKFVIFLHHSLASENTSISTCQIVFFFRSWNFRPDLWTVRRGLKKLHFANFEKKRFESLINSSNPLTSVCYSLLFFFLCEVVTLEKLSVCQNRLS
jgi:hypothetical protein